MRPPCRAIARQQTLQPGEKLAVAVSQASLDGNDDANPAASAPSPASAAAASTDAVEIEGFMPAKSFEGARAGMVFKNGVCGVGYYPDSASGSRKQVDSLADIDE